MFLMDPTVESVSPGSEFARHGVDLHIKAAGAGIIHLHGALAHPQQGEQDRHAVFLVPGNDPKRTDRMRINGSHLGMRDQALFDDPLVSFQLFHIRRIQKAPVRRAQIPPFTQIKHFDSLAAHTESRFDEQPAHTGSLNPGQHPFSRAGIFPSVEQYPIADG